MMPHLARWDYKGLMFEGLSLAGVRTCLTIPQHSLAFDVGPGFPFALGMKTFLITHGHMDHAAGIPYLISQKNMNSHQPASFLMPTSLVGPMEDIMSNWQTIEGHQYQFNFIGITPGEIFPLSPQLYLCPFPTVHRLPSQGYSLYRRFRKLRRDLAHLSGEEIGRLHHAGEEVTEERAEILVSFTGDTQIEFLDLAPEIKASKILIVEATYLDEKKTIANTKEWGHLHLDELLPRLPEIQSERVVLIHTSARYSFDEAERIISQKLPPHEKERVLLFPGR